MAADPKMDTSVSSTGEAFSVQLSDESEESLSKDGVDKDDDVICDAVVPRHSLEHPRYRELYLQQSDDVIVVDSNADVEYNDESTQYKDDWRNLMRVAADMRVRLDDLMVRGSSEVDDIQTTGRSSLKQCLDELLFNTEEFYERVKKIYDKLP